MYIPHTCGDPHVFPRINTFLKLSSRKTIPFNTGFHPTLFMHGGKVNRSSTSSFFLFFSPPLDYVFPVRNVVRNQIVTTAFHLPLSFQAFINGESKGSYVILYISTICNISHNATGRFINPSITFKSSKSTGGG